ncbi:unnamed protein product [Lepeophtheirus salmonis]|uniref:(salmon louse) hypothetical protein n=1 Tax=Lepeophtheirus salmonis TaxID=72036 RepID=A0A7R8D4W4_LEPSM|nr:unnamed protein product [Lepeophtheirus salmonis]CAF3029656.1 unnamed protein product [Lepeophtheirus salmonis]
MSLIIIRTTCLLNAIQISRDLTHSNSIRVDTTICICTRSYPEESLGLKKEMSCTIPKTNVPTLTFLSRTVIRTGTFLLLKEDLRVKFVRYFPTISIFPSYVVANPCFPKESYRIKDTRHKFLPNGIPVVQWLILPRRILRVLSIRLRIGSSIYDNCMFLRKLKKRLLIGPSSDQPFTMFIPLFTMFLPNGIPVVQWLILPRRILKDLDDNDLIIGITKVLRTIH